MNGEISQMCRIVSAARTALRDDTEFKFTPVSYEENIVFNFCDRTNSGGMRFHAKDPADWFKHLKKEGIKSVFLVESLKINRRQIAIINNSASTIFVRYEDGIVTRFVANWIMNESSGKWNVVYNETIAENAPEKDPEFRNEGSMLEANLKDIAELADKLGEEKFAAKFRKALSILNGEVPTLKQGAAVPQIPDDLMKYYLACDVSDVFGLSGSWSDEPAKKATELGLENDYSTLSDRLLCSVRLMTMYSINFPV